jgi:DNA polymerase I-like protein with 3'-5' exonuclease and polymerase domains
MPEDLSYLLSKPTEEEEEKVRKAVEQECIRAISQYLAEVSDTMEKNGIETLNVATLRGMAQQFTNRLNNEENEAS